jgi:hypothetical protein|tara:strand:+ start:1011 stop:1592 length:582 start_codon:yes stop_codon:yes gene_type:complete
MSRAIDLFVTYRFLKLLVTPWNKQEAYKEGIIDKNGKNLIKARDLSTVAQRESYTLLHRLVFNCKRIMQKIPLVRTQLGTYATALFLLREKYNIEHLPEGQITKYLFENNLVSIDNKISEEVVGFGNMLPIGEYKLKDQVTADDDEIDAQPGDKVSALEDTPPSDRILGVDIFPVLHQKSKKIIYVSLEDIDD